MNTSIKILLTVKDKTFELTIQEAQELQKTLNLINPPILPSYYPPYYDKYKFKGSDIGLSDNTNKN